MTKQYFSWMSTAWWTHNGRRRQHQRGFRVMFLHRRHCQRMSIQLQPWRQPGPGMQLEPSGDRGFWYYRIRLWWWRRRRSRRSQRSSDGGAAAPLALQKQHPLTLTSSPPQLGPWEKQRGEHRDEPEKVRLQKEQHLLFHCKGNGMVVELGSVAAVCPQWAVSTVHTSHLFSCSHRFLMHTFSSIPSSPHLEIMVDESEEEYHVSHRIKKWWLNWHTHIFTTIILLVFNATAE